MTGPTLLVKLDDGTGTFPYDISQYVDLHTPLNINRGRSDELSQIQAAVLTLTLTNTDGRFTFGSATYNCAIDQMIRVTETVGATTSNRFTGYVQNWPTVWPGGGDTYSTVTITAVDLFARLARHKLRAMTIEEYMLDGPSAYFTCQEDAAAVTAGDSSGHLVAPLRFTGTGTAPVFSDTGVTFAAGQYLTGGPIDLGVATTMTVELVVNRNGLPPDQKTLVMWKTTAGLDYAIAIEQLGGIVTIWQGTSTSATAVSVTDGKDHHIAVTTAAGAWNVYVDGVLALSSPVFPAAASIAVLNVGGGVPMTGGASAALNPFDGKISHVAITQGALSAARIASHANAQINGFNTERSDQRVARILSYFGITTVALETGLQTAVPAQSTDDVYALDAINAINESEGGIFFIRGDGVPVMQNRFHRALQTSTDWSITNNDIDPGTSFSADMQGIANYATSKSVTGGVQIVKNAASIAKHEQYPVDMAVLVATDAEARDVANWRVNTKAEPQARMAGVVIDLMTQLSPFQQAGLTLELSDRLTITGLPSQAPVSPAELVIEGSTESLSVSDWQLALNTSNWNDHWAWVLDNATYSVLGTTTRLR